MPDLYDCLQTAIDGNAINRTRAQRAQQDFLELRDRYARHMPMAAASAAADADVKKAMAASAIERRHRTLAQLQRMRANALFIEGADRPDLAIKSLLEYGEGRGHDVESVRSIRDALTRQFRGMIPELLRAGSRNLAGQARNKALLGDVVRVLHGETVSSPAATAMAASFRAVARRARSLFNAHGGNIGELADWGLPHSHDPVKMRKAGFDAWRAEVAPRLDWSRIVDQATGLPFAAKGQQPDPAATQRMLRDVYDGLITHGWDDRVPGLTTGGKALAGRRADARILHFRDATDWLAYNEAFGSADPFTGMVQHLDGMARDIALMRVLGPNPAAGLEHAIQVATRKAELGGDPKVANQVTSASVRAKAMMSHLTGAANQPADAYWAGLFAGTRAVLTSAQLGSAILSSTTDLWSLRMAANAVGMSGANVLSRSVALLSSSATRATAARMGYVADTLADVGSTQARFFGEVWAPELAQRLSSFVMRASGLSFWTDMNRAAFLMEMSGFMAENAGRALGDLDAPLRNLLTRRGITEAEWALLSDPDLLFTADTGATFLAPLYWREAALAKGLPSAQVEGLSTRLSAIMEEQLEFAVPSVTLEGRTALIGDAPPGTFYGELIRSTAMYKNFGLSVTINQYRRVMAQPDGMARAQYFASLVAGLTVLGAVSVQLKEIAKGNDPRPMDRPEFWGAAVFQGGGLGIFGDFFSANTSRAGGGLAETLTGPVGGLVGDVSRAVASNVTRAAEGKDPLIGRDIANLARRYTPGTSIWYGRLALDRLVWDQLQDFLDPEAGQQWRRRAMAAQRERGTQPYWRQGEMMPDRAPDLANILPEGRP